MKNLTHLSSILLLLAALGCGAKADYAGEPNGTATPSPGDPTPAPTATPPEGDDDAFSILPAGSDQYVFIANPVNDNVARIKIAPPVSIDIIPVGDRPEELLVSPDDSFFATFNAGSSTVTRQPIPDGDQRTYPVREGVNHLELSPQGTHGFSWYVDALAQGTQQPTSDVSLIDFTVDPEADPDGAVFSGFIGPQPRQVGWAPDDSAAFVLANDRITAIDLDVAGKPRTPIPLGLASNLAAKEMVLSANADSALVLAENLDTLILVDLINLTTSSVTVGPAGGGTSPTDLDVTPDGQFFVVANVGDPTSQIDLIDTVTAARTEIPISGVAGSVEVSPDSQTLYVFSKGALDERLFRVDISNPGAPVIDEFPLVKPVRSVYVTPDSQSLVILHRFEDVADGDPFGEEQFADDDVVTLVQLDPVLPSFYPHSLVEEPAQVAVTPDGSYAYFMMEQTMRAASADLGSLLLDDVELSATPLFIGAVDDNHTGYVLQKHPLGRITFVRQAAPGYTVQTITGFELNAQ